MVDSLPSSSGKVRPTLGSSGYITPNLGCLVDSGFKTTYRVTSEQSILKQIFSGTSFVVSKTQKFIVCACSNKLNIVDLETGALTSSILCTDALEEDSLLSFALAPNDDDLVITFRSQLMRLNSISKTRGTKEWKGHDPPPTLLSFSPDGVVLAAASPEGSLQLWDVFHGFLLHNFAVDGRSLSLTFHHKYFNVLAVTSMSGSFALLDCDSRRSLHKIKDHFSHCTSACFLTTSTDDLQTLQSNERFCTVSHDKTIQIYEFRANSSKDNRNIAAEITGLSKVNMVVVVEEMSCVRAVDWNHFVVVGTSGFPQIFNIHSKINSTKSCTEPVSQGGKKEVHCPNLLSCEYLSGTEQVLILNDEQNVVFYEVTRTKSDQSGAFCFNFNEARTLAGNLDAVADVKWLDDNGERFALATNSSTARVYSRNCMFCRELRGHTDIVGCLAVSHDQELLATGSKDMTVRVWSSKTCQPVAVLTGHTSFITSLCFSNTSNPINLFTCDGCGIVKIWKCEVPVVSEPLEEKGKKKRKKNTSQDASDDQSNLILKVTLIMTLQAHEGSTTTISISPNDFLLATGGKDKVVKLWKLAGLWSMKKSSKKPTLFTSVDSTTSSHDLQGLQATVFQGLSSKFVSSDVVVPLRGHKRVVLCVRFSAVSKLLASSCAFGHVLLWNLRDNACIVTIQNEKNIAINCLCFMNQGTQLATSDSHGLLKLWVVKDGQCLSTFSGHGNENEENRDIWCLDVTKTDQYIVSGGIDSTVRIWTDCTESDKQEELKQLQEVTMNTQKLQGCIKRGAWQEGIDLALSLRRKNDLRLLVSHMVRALGTVSATKSLQDIFVSLSLFPTSAGSEADSAIPTAERGNQLLDYCREWNAHSLHCHVAQVVLRAIFSEISPETLSQNDMIQKSLESLLAYSRRHYVRLSGLILKSFLLDKLLSEALPSCLNNTSSSLTPMESQKETDSSEED